MKKFFIVIIILLISTLTSIIFAENERYKFAAQSDEIMVYFDIITLQCKIDSDDKMYVDTWLKYQIIEEKRQNFIDKFGLKYKDTDYILVHMYFKKNTYAQIGNHFYDKNGNTIESFKSSCLIWDDIIPESVNEIVQKEIMAYIISHPEII